MFRNIILPKTRVATGIYSHWDSIIKVDKEIIKWIKNSNGIKSNNILNSIEEVIYSLKDSVKNGDNESLISRKVYNELNLLFPKREFRLGGNGNNMSRALFELGITPLVSYPIRSEKLMKASPNFKVACKNGFKTPKEAIRKNDPDYDHIIFESEKWRSIFSWDLMTSQGIFDLDFLKFAFNPKFIDLTIISYAHLLLPKYKKRTDFLLDFIKRKRSKIHLEFGLGCEESMKYAMKKFSEIGCESWGLNEKECKIYLKANSENKEDLIEAALEALKEYNIKRICVHSSKFVFSVSKYNTKKEIEALIAGCIATNPKSSTKLKGKFLKKNLNQYNICIVPVVFNPNIRKVTGIGDKFAAVQAVKILS